MAKGPRNLALDFGADTLTHYGGVTLSHRYLSRIGLKRSLGQASRVEQRNNRYSIGETRRAMLYPMILGLERIETTQLLRQNGVCQYLTGLRIPIRLHCGDACCAWRRRYCPNCVHCTIACSRA